MHILSHEFYFLQPNSKEARDNLVLISAGRWIYAVSTIDGAISWGKEFSHDGYA
jgi:ER membrane protein complex subunit 1